MISARYIYDVAVMIAMASAIIAVSMYFFDIDKTRAIAEVALGIAIYAACKNGGSKQ